MEDLGKKKLRRGRRSPWHPDLGVTSQKTPRFPNPVWALLDMDLLIKLLNWMAMVPEFQAKILKQIPEGDPPSFVEQQKKAARKNAKKPPPSQ